MSRLPTLMPLLAILSGILGYFFAPVVSQGKSLIVPLLSFIMLCMGLTLKIRDFSAVISQPRPLFIGLALQFLMMPLLAWLISLGLNLPTALMAGMVLVGTAPGGTASNVLVYLSGGSVALSVSMTTLATLIAIIATPLLTGFYLQARIDVDQLGMLISILQVVVIPVLTGTLINSYKPDLVKVVHGYLPSLSVLAIATAIAIVVSLNAKNMETMGVTVLAGVLLHNTAGLVSGYWLARITGCSIQQSRTIAIEVGTQNSGLSVALAIKHFTAIAALPGAIFSVTQNILGACLATYWLLEDKRKEKPQVQI